MLERLRDKSDQIDTLKTDLFISFLFGFFPLRMIGSVKWNSVWAEDIYSSFLEGQLFFLRINRIHRRNALCLTSAEKKTLNTHNIVFAWPLLIVGTTIHWIRTYCNWHDIAVMWSKCFQSIQAIKRKITIHFHFGGRGRWNGVSWMAAQLRNCFRVFSTTTNFSMCWYAEWMEQ